MCCSRGCSVRSRPEEGRVFWNQVTAGFCRPARAFRFLAGQSEVGKASEPGVAMMRNVLWGDESDLRAEDGASSEMMPQAA